MRRLTATLCAAVMLLMVGCDTASTTKTASPPEAGSSETAAMPSETASMPKEDVAGAYGTRTNPYPPGYTATVKGESGGDAFEFTVTIDNIVRGEDAKKRALEASEFNEIEADEEFLFFDVSIELLKWNPTEEDTVFFTEHDFEVYKSDNTLYETDNYVSFDEALGGRIAEGEKLSGVVPKVIPKDDDSLLLFWGVGWFALKGE